MIDLIDVDAVVFGRSLQEGTKKIEILSSGCEMPSLLALDQFGQSPEGIVR